MNKWSFPIMLMVSLVFMASDCQKEQSQPNITDQDAAFIFGTAYGFCASDCVHLFKMSGGKVYPDLMDRGNPSEADFSETPLSDVKYRLALPVRNQFPQALFAEETIIGCPNCADQGAYFIQIEREGEVFQWTIDTNEGSLPEYLRPYAKMMGEVVMTLRE